MFRYLQSRIRGTAGTGPGVPPPGLIDFYWHFVRQTKGWYAWVFITSLAVALIDMVIPVFIGKLVALMETADRHAAIAASDSVTEQSTHHAAKNCAYNVMLLRCLLNYLLGFVPTLLRWAIDGF